MFYTLKGRLLQRERRPFVMHWLSRRCTAGRLTCNKHTQTNGFTVHRSKDTYRVQVQQRLRIKLKKHRTDIAASLFLTNNSPTFVRPYNHTNAGLVMQAHPQQECSLSLFNWLCPAATSAFSTNLLLQQQKERP